MEPENTEDDVVLENWTITTDEESGEPRVRMTVPKRSQEKLRETVVGLLDGTLYPSVAVPRNLIPMVYMPVAFGGFCVPEKCRKLVMSPEEAPEVPEDPPEEPVPESHPPRPAVTAEPLLKTYSKDLAFKAKWGDIDEDEWDAHRAEIDEANEKLKAEYELAIIGQEEVLGAWVAACEGVDLKHLEALRAHGELVEGWEARKQEAQKVRDGWYALHGRIFGKWAADVGCLLGDMKSAAPRSINGYPMFFACSIIHLEDWERVHAAVMRESARMQEMEI
mgnify:CR=1 FL=1|tara:strand:- start:1072 stop:1905 length:834 start_codon:yes stop_codon:yes gene_type:complete